MRFILLPFFLLLCINLLCQDEPVKTPLPPPSFISKRFLVKANVLSIAAQRPNISGEYFFNPHFTLEVSYVSGFFKPLLWVEKYSYKGLLVRAKLLMDPAEPGEVSPYAGLYAGTLRKSIFNDKRPRFASGGVQDFTRNSFRTGLTLGGQWIGKKRMVIDYQNSLGLGSYFRYRSSSDGPQAGNYLDIQVWLSVGYLF